MRPQLPTSVSQGQVLLAQQGGLGLVTLNRPEALNALSLAMVRDITAALRHWRADDAVHAVLLRGAPSAGRPAAFCAGGDVRFFHQAALTGDPTVEDFFTEEYTLDYLIHTYPKPTIALMDGITMGGGMGLAQGARLRVVTERSQLAMPETLIGLFPDVGGGWFLSRCPGRLGEFLALSGRVLGAHDAITAGLADVFVPGADLPALMASLTDQPLSSGEQALASLQARVTPPPLPSAPLPQGLIDMHFALDSALAVVCALEASAADGAQPLAAELRRRSPLMLEVALRQIRLAREMPLADALRMERGMVRQCLRLRPGAASETVEGIRALVIDKDRAPRWNPPRLEAVQPADVLAYFQSPWPAHAHPLENLGRGL